MKQKLHQPKVSPSVLRGISVSGKVFQIVSLFFPILIVFSNHTFAKRTVPIAEMPTCSMSVSVTANPSPACVGNILTLTVGVTGGTGPYTYSWVGPVPADFSTTVTTSTVTTPALTLSDGGFYTVHVTDATGCTSTGVALVSVYSNPVLEVLGSPTPVCTGNTLFLTSGFSSGGTGTVTYAWSGPSGYTSTDVNPTVNGVTSAAAGVYSVTVIDNHGCHGYGTTASVSVITNTVTVTTSSAVSICSGTSTTLSASGATTYDWNPSTGLSPTSGSVVTATPTTSTVYTVTGHVGTCLRSASIAVSILPQYSVTASAGTDGTISSSGVTSVCSGSSITYTVTPNPGYHISDIQVDGSSIGTSPTFTLTSVSAPHTVTASFAPDCTTPSITSTTGGATCGAGSVALGATASAGTINWYTSSTGGTSLGTGTSYSPTVSSTTTYYVDATDGSCVSSRTAITASVNPVPSASASASDVLCYGGSTGSVTVTASGGTPAYSGTGTFSGLAAGSYSYTVTDASGCTTSASATVGQPSSALSVSSTVTDVACYGGSTGSVTVAATGGTPSYTGTGTFSGLSAGAFSYTVTDANGCTASATGTLTEPASLIASASVSNVLCNGGSTGSVTVTATGGTPSYTGTGTFSGLTAGSFSYTVTDANGCSTAVTGTVTEPSVLSVATTVTNVLCNGGSTGSVAVTASGGTPSYSGDGTFSGLVAGSYSYTVTDANGCSVTASATVTQPLTALSAAAAVTNVSCYGGSNGSVTVSGAGGTTPYTGTGTYSGLAAGSYSYTVTDANGCTAGTSGTVTQPSSALVSSSVVTDVLCHGGSTGTVVVNATGGTPGYSGTGTFSGLTAGSYSYTVTDANGCTATTSGSVSEPLALTASSTVTNVTCYGGSNGSVTVAASGGTSSYSGTGVYGSLTAGTYSYTVTDANGCTAATTATVSQPSSALALSSSITNVVCYGTSTGAVTITASGGSPAYTGTGSFTGLAAGTYSYTVTDAAGCTATTTATVTQPSTGLTAACAVTNVACYGGSTGSIVVTASGGVLAYTGTGTYSGLTAGSYLYTVTDASGCTATASATVTQPATLTLSGSVSNAMCYGLSNGSITSSVSGGTAGYTYLWSTGGTSSSVSSLPAGVYSVTVTDANGCNASGTYTVSQPSALAVSGTVTNVSCYGAANGSVTTSVTGGTAGYSYAWSSGSTSSSISGRGPGTYTVTVTDAHSCTTTGSYTITEPAPLVCTISTRHGIHDSTPDTVVYIGYGVHSIDLTDMVSGGTPGYTYSWAPDTGTGSTLTVHPSSNTTYTVTATDAHGCTTSCTIAIYVHDIRCCSHSEDVCGRVKICIDGHQSCVDTALVASYLASGATLGPCHGHARGTAPAGTESSGAGDNINVYPNPSDGTFSVQIPAEYKNAELSVTDITGRVLQSRSIADNTGAPTQISLPGVAPGIYILHVNAESRKYSVKLSVR